MEVFSNEKQKLSQSDLQVKVKAFWTNIYQKHQNNIDTIWNEEKQRDYMEDLNSNNNDTLQIVYNKRPDVVLPLHLVEHYNMVQGTIERGPTDKATLKTHEDQLRRVTIDRNLQEHFDASEGEILEKNGRKKMKKIVFTINDVKKQLSKIKTNKQPGPDELKV